MITSKLFLLFFTVIFSIHLGSVFAEDPPQRVDESNINNAQTFLKIRNVVSEGDSANTDTPPQNSTFEEQYEQLYKDNPEGMKEYYNTQDLEPSEREFLTDLLTGEGDTDCKDNIASSVCERRIDEKEQELAIGRYEGKIKDETNNNEIKNAFNTELISLGITDSGCSDSLSEDCKNSISSHSCKNDANCERNKRTALALYETARGSQRVSNEDPLIQIATYTNIDESSYATAQALQELFDWEDFNILDKVSSGVRDALELGTPQQVCLAKVDSYVSVSGVEVEGKEYTAQDSSTGLSSRQKMCDDLQFNVCADVRAERSSMYFNDSFSLTAHIYVYNSQDYTQLLVLNSELRDVVNGDVTQTENLNLFELHPDIDKSIIELSPKGVFSQSLYFSDMQAFNGALEGELFANVLLSVYKQIGEDSTSVSSINFEYGLDYPVVELGDVITDSTLTLSGVSAIEGTEEYDSSLLERVVID